MAWTLSPIWCPQKKQEIWTQKHTRRIPCDHGGRGWRGTATSQGTPRSDGHPQKLEEARQGSTQCQREPGPEPGPADTWNLGF